MNQSSPSSDPTPERTPDGPPPGGCGSGVNRVLSTMFCAGLVVLGLYLFVASIFSVDGEFYARLLMPFIPILFILTIVQAVWYRPRGPVRIIMLLIILALAGIAAVYEYRKAVDARIPVIAAEEADLRRYYPHTADNHLVTLGEPSTLRLEGDALPRLDGATALYPVYAAFVQAVYPWESYEPRLGPVRMSKTGTAYDRLIAGETDIIFVARPSAGHRAKAAKAGVELHLTPIGHEAFVFYVNARNPVSGLSQQQIRGIYGGEIRQWREVGGPDLPIRAFQRPEDSGSQTMLLHIMGDHPLMDPPQRQVVMGMGGIIARTADYKNYPDAIGYSFRYFATTMINNGVIHLLSIDGIAPTRATIADGSYPFTTDIYAVTTRPADPAISALLEWIVGEQGQHIIDQTGYVPLRKNRVEDDSTTAGQAP